MHSLFSRAKSFRTRSFFFFNDTATTEIYTLSHTTLFRSVEVHPNPEEALSDGAQSLYPEQFAQLMREVRVIAEVIGRRRSEEHTSELQSRLHLVCRLLLEKKKKLDNNHLSTESSLMQIDR